MKEYDLVELLVEKTGYAKYGVHKGMQGCVFDSRSMDGSWLINFPLYGEKGDIATISVEETDLKPIDCSNINITMQEDAQALDEVVVIGYGTAKKKDLTGAISNIRPTDLKAEMPCPALLKIAPSDSATICSNVAFSNLVP